MEAAMEAYNEKTKDYSINYGGGVGVNERCCRIC